MDVPDLDDALIDKIATQSDEQAGDRSIRDLERIRDENLAASCALSKETAVGLGLEIVHRRSAHARASGDA